MATATQTLSIEPGAVAGLEFIPSPYSSIPETFFKPSMLEPTWLLEGLSALAWSSPFQLSPSHTGLAVGYSVGYSSPPQLSPVHAVGSGEGFFVGFFVGSFEGTGVGAGVGTGVGSGLGARVGNGVGSAVGTGVGAGVGSVVVCSSPPQLSPFQTGLEVGSSVG
jgi:hypothetical protein